MHSSQTVEKGVLTPWPPRRGRFFETLRAGHVRPLLRDDIKNLPMQNVSGGFVMQFYSAVLYPSGLWLCQFQLWAHISSMPYWASQPSSRLALEGSHQHSAMSPGRRGSMT